MSDHNYIIKVLDNGGNWYDNAFIENSFDAIQICKFYREMLRYSVKLFRGEKDITPMIDSTKTVLVKTD